MKTSVVLLPLLVQVTAGKFFQAGAPISLYYGGTHGHHFFRRGGEDFFSFVHGSKMALGEVMFLGAVAWVKGG